MLIIWLKNRFLGLKPKYIDAVEMDAFLFANSADPMTENNTLVMGSKLMP